MGIGYIYFLAVRFWGYKNRREVDEEDNLWVWRMHRYHAEHERRKYGDPDKKPEKQSDEHRRIYDDPQYQANQDKLAQLRG